MFNAVHPINSRLTVAVMGNSPIPASAPNIGSTQAKYTAPSRLVQFANERFFHTLEEMLDRVSPESILDAGCGEGVILDRLKSVAATGMDLDLWRVREARSRQVGNNLGVCDVHALPFPPNSFDLVLMLEVFEHVGSPRLALSEVARVTRRYLLASVPNEPWWRIGNMLRLKYLRAFGNTPEHLQHWTVRGFRRFISDEFTVTESRKPFLWTFILAEKSPRATF